MIRLSAKARIAMGMATLVVTMLMLADMLGMIPDPRIAAMQSRCAVSELIALQIRPVILQEDLVRIEAMLEAVVRRNDDILSGAVRRRDGKVVALVGDHKRLWDTQILVSDDRQVYVPLSAAGDNWGRVEICFKPLMRHGVLGLLDSPALRLTGLTGLLCWVAFYFYLRKMLSNLDPSRAVPGRVRNALDTLGDGLLVLDRDARIVLVNRSLAESIETSPDKLVGVKAAKLPWVLTEEQTAGGFPWTRAIDQGKSIQGETLRYGREGADDAVFLSSCSPVPGSDGSPQGVLVSLDDVTELEETKQELSHAKDAAEEANHAKSAFLANMSHEIRTPMNAILGFTEVLRRGIEHDESKRRKHLNTIHSSGTHLLNLINDILDLSKVEADRLEVESIPCAVHQVVAEVVTVMAVRAEEKGVTLDYQFDGKIPESITTDPARLRQILTNLVGNAIKFTEQGGVRIITKLQRDQDRGEMVIEVIDSGIGMSETAADKIFDPFSQADASVTRRFGGTGLGLSISKRFAEALGGDISVHSEQGVGSVFVVRIDAGPLDDMTLIQPTEADVEAPVTGDQALSIRLPNLRVLVVDDGEENRDLMSLILQEAGATFATAENGLQAFESATQQDWDVILMDMQMPVMDGYTATRKLRDQGYQKPIIALTAHAMQHAEQRCREAGCSGFLSKPVEFDKLIAALAEIAGLDVELTKSTADAPSITDETVTPAAGQSTSPAQETQAPAINSSPIRSSLASMGASFTPIIDEFVDRLPAKLEEMQTALQHSDFEQLAMLAHWLKGSGPNVGFAELGGPAKQLETYAKQSDSEAAAKMITQLRAVVKRIETTPPASAAITTRPCDKNLRSSNLNEPPAGAPVSSSLSADHPQTGERVTGFIDRLEGQFDALEAALAAADSGQLTDLALTLKASSSDCGFPQMATLAGTLELFATDGDLELTAHILGQLREMRTRIVAPDTVAVAE
jgi:PAS domain S-box-containing protein